MSSTTAPVTPVTTVTTEQSKLALDCFRNHCFQEITLACSRFQSDLISALQKQTDAETSANMERKEIFRHEFVYRALSELSNKRLREGEDGLPRQYIVCPFEDKDAAKELGARWDSKKRKWYALGDETFEKLKKWHPSNPSTPVAATDDEAAPEPPSAKRVKASE